LAWTAINFLTESWADFSFCISSPVIVYVRPSCKASLCLLWLE